MVRTQRAESKHKGDDSQCGSYPWRSTCKATHHIAIVLQIFLHGSWHGRHSIIRALHCSYVDRAGPPFLTAGVYYNDRNAAKSHRTFMKNRARFLNGGVEVLVDVVTGHGNSGCYMLSKMQLNSQLSSLSWRRSWKHCAQNTCETSILSTSPSSTQHPSCRSVVDAPLKYGTKAPTPSTACSAAWLICPRPPTRCLTSSLLP